MAGNATWLQLRVMGRVGSGALETPIAPVATTLTATTSGTYSTNDDGGSVEWTPTVLGIYGARTQFTATRDLSAYKYIGMQMQHTGMPFTSKSNTPAGLIDTLANGGMSHKYFDSSGNWSEFYYYGSEQDEGSIENGGWAQFRGAGNAGCLQLAIDKDRTPEASSGVLDWTAIDGVESYMRTTSTNGTGNLQFQAFSTFDPVVLTGGTAPSPATFDDFGTFFKTYADNFQYSDVFKTAGANFLGGVGTTYEPRFTYRLGDGITPLHFRDSGSTVAWYLRGEDAGVPQGALYLNGVDRGDEIITTATCDLIFSGTVFAAFDVVGGEAYLDISGDSAGSVVFDSAQIYRRTYINFRHSVVLSTIIDTCYQIEIDLDTTVTDTTIRNNPATSKGLYIQSAAGTYTASVDFRASNLGDDITINTPVDDTTYNFPNITVEDGYTIKLRNDHITNEVTIGIPTGMPFTTSTAGGIINVSTPPVTVTYAAPNLLDNTRVRLYNVTQARQIENIVVAGGSGYSRVLTLGTDYNTNDEMTLLGTYQQLGVAKRVFRASTLLTTSDVTTVDFQVDWDNAGPNTLAIDGSNIPECTTDYIEIQVEVNDSDNTTTKARIAAFIVDAITTELGITNWVALDGTAVIKYSTNTAAEIDASVANVEVINVKPSSQLQVKDSFEFSWSDGIDRVGSVPAQDSDMNWLAPARVLLQAIGSGVTEQDKTDIAALINPNIFDMQGTGFDTNNDSLVEIRDNQGGGGGGDATEANQIAMLNNQASILGDTSNLLVLSDVTYNELLTKSSQFSVDAIQSDVNNLQTSVDALPSDLENADTLLARDIQGGSTGGRSVTQALRANRNRVDMISGDVYEEDDLTVSHSYSVTRAELDAVSEVDPT